MAVLSTIRNKVGVIIGFVGVSMALFIIGPEIMSNQGLFGGANTVGEVGGERISFQDFEARVDRMVENYKANSQQDNLDENTTEMIREQVWNSVLNEHILGKQYEAIGISCSPKELLDMCTGKNVHPQVRQAFTDPKTGVFDPAAVLNTLKDLPNRPENIQQQWRTFETALRDERIAEKYKSLIKGGLYATKAEAKTDYYDRTRTANIRFLQLSYTTFADSAVKVEDSDLDNYYNAHKKDYEQKESVRKVDYVIFDISPSSEDRQEVMKWISEKKAAFDTTDNDTVFVNQYSDVPFDSSFHPKGMLSMTLDTVFFNAPTGTIIGPYEEAGAFKVSKLVSVQMVPDSVRARHILLKIDNGDTASARAKADSLRSLIKKGMPFEMLALANSTDQAANMKGGDLGWFRRKAMVKPFEDAAFNGKKGELVIVQTDFGVHLLEITDKGVPVKQIQVATVQRSVEPSQRTYDAAYQKAQQFVSADPTGEKFDSTAAKMNLSKRTADNLRESEKNIAGLDKPREIVRWAFQAKLNELSKVFTLGDKYVIAKLVAIREKGTLPLDQVRDQVMAAVRKEKKGTLLAEKFQAQMTGATTIEALGQKMNLSVFPAGNISFAAPYVQGMGTEPKVVGQLFGLKKNQLSKPIIGDNGVFVIVVDLINEPPAPADLVAAQKQVADGRKQRSEYEVFNALKEKAKVVDNRGRFY